MSRLFVIGNGFDLSHELPTRFDLDFKNIAESFEQNENFWALYQTEKQTSGRTLKIVWEHQILIRWKKF